ncbi:uncharacterized protein LOC125475618 [Pyrus x bretschneideri]|uniref:uncharacterized protein LOC125475618 n=1 Tax=Pyrus x bretschneideri TaxID=225117 RepID=UPI00202E9A21|nr:uncharacterized protein LOC125475618 [Pyrus x bretschneideri]
MVPRSVGKITIAKLIGESHRAGNDSHGVEEDSQGEEKAFTKKKRTSIVIQRKTPLIAPKQGDGGTAAPSDIALHKVGESMTGLLSLWTTAVVDLHQNTVVLETQQDGHNTQLI